MRETLATRERKKRAFWERQREQWEARLTRMGLSMERGRHDWLTYGHIVSEIDYDGVNVYAKKERQ